MLRFVAGNAVQIPNQESSEKRIILLDRTNKKFRQNSAQPHRMPAYKAGSSAHSAADRQPRAKERRLDPDEDPVPVHGTLTRKNGVLT